ncbi:MAG: DUF3990 domain-containing protein [Bacteroidales bacterium]|nr:DUF3990 domain-containing protein [Bacteroidales bacterium]
MKLLHGSNVVVKKPDLNLCRSKNDFGKGFYMTPNWNRAWEMGKRRKNILQSGEITVNAFNFSLKEAKAAGLKIAIFSGFTIEWARFIINNRDNEFFSHNYDIVIGPVADAILDQEIYRHKMLFGAKYLEDEPLKAFIGKVSQFGSSYIQYCFCTQNALG